MLDSFFFSSLVYVSPVCEPKVYSGLWVLQIIFFLLCHSYLWFFFNKQSKSFCSGDRYYYVERTWEHNENGQIRFSSCRSLALFPFLSVSLIGTHTPIIPVLSKLALMILLSWNCVCVVIITSDAQPFAVCYHRHSHWWSFCIRFCLVLYSLLFITRNYLLWFLLSICVLSVLRMYRRTYASTAMFSKLKAIE